MLLYVNRHLTRTIRDGESQDGHVDFHTASELRKVWWALETAIAEEPMRLKSREFGALTYTFPFNAHHFISLCSRRR